MKPANIYYDDEWFKWVKYRCFDEFKKEIEELCQTLITKDCSMRSDVLTKVIGPNHHGRLRGLGCGTMISRVDAKELGASSNAQLRDKVRILELQMQEMKTFMIGAHKSKAHETGNKNIYFSRNENQELLKSGINSKDKNKKLKQFHSSPPIEVGGTKKYVFCKLLHWLGTGQVVAKAILDCKDVAAHVHIPLEPDCQYTCPISLKSQNPT
ncbi:hypothetical protein Sjap_008483 [Stephania japonica]|uniref:Uncharacterized protein n=1 Tax=Stephania japonica TaxID=461633 RepID=A0AAP0PCD8_9MAGN